MEFVIWGILWAILCGMVAPTRGRSAGNWVVLGFLFSVFALLALMVLPKDEAAIERKALTSKEARKCPKCAELVKHSATVCRFCGHRFGADTIPVNKGDVTVANEVPEPAQDKTESLDVTPEREVTPERNVWMAITVLGCIGAFAFLCWFLQPY